MRDSVSAGAAGCNKIRGEMPLVPPYSEGVASRGGGGGLAHPSGSSARKSSATILASGPIVGYNPTQSNPPTSGGPSDAHHQRQGAGAEEAPLRGLVDPVPARARRRRLRHAARPDRARGA